LFLEEWGMVAGDGDNSCLPRVAEKEVCGEPQAGRTLSILMNVIRRYFDEQGRAW